MNNSFDKKKTCQGCPDRSINCHAVCQAYLERRRLRNERNQERRRASQADCMTKERVVKLRSHIINKQKQSRHHY